jgi:catalase
VGDRLAVGEHRTARLSATQTTEIGANQSLTVGRSPFAFAALAEAPHTFDYWPAVRLNRCRVRVVEAIGKRADNRQGVRPTTGVPQNHAKGVAVAGYFDSNGNASGLSKASVFRHGRTPVVGRFSLAGGEPHVTDAPAVARGMGLVFGFPGGEQWRMALLNLPVFLDNSPQGFYDRLIASAVVPATGRLDPTAMARFLAAHPETARAMAIVKQHPPTPGFADSTYRGLSAFYFVDGSNTRVPVRWSLTPLQRALPPSSEDPVSDQAPVQASSNALFDALIRQLRAGPLRWHLTLTVGAPSDPTSDATLPWRCRLQSVRWNARSSCYPKCRCTRFC